MQKHVNLVDLVKSFPTNIFMQNLASIQKRTSLIKFDHLAEKSAEYSISNLSTKVMAQLRGVPVQVAKDAAEGLSPREGGGHEHIHCRIQPVVMPAARTALTGRREAVPWPLRCA